MKIYDCTKKAINKVLKKGSARDNCFLEKETKCKNNRNTFSDSKNTVWANLKQQKVSSFRKFSLLGRKIVYHKQIGRTSWLGLQSSIADGKNRLNRDKMCKRFCWINKFVWVVARQSWKFVLCLEDIKMGVGDAEKCSFDQTRYETHINLKHFIFSNQLRIAKLRSIPSSRETNRFQSHSNSNNKQTHFDN